MRWLLVLPFLVALVSCHFDGASCGSEKKCVYVPPGCQEHNVCKQIFSYSPKEDGFVDMELYSTENTPGTNYMAVGFSKDDLMGDDSVTQCVFPENGKPEAHVSFNFGKSNQPPQEKEEKSNEPDNVQLLNGHKDEEAMYCLIRQKISGGDSQFFPNLNQDNTIFLARGKARKPELLGIHSLDPSSPDFPHVTAEKHNVGKRQSDDNQKNQGNGSAPGVAAGVVPAATPAPAAEESWLTKSMRFWIVKTHGMIMLFAWLFCVPLAIFAARYFRDHWPGNAPWGLKWWFHLHRSFNFLAVFLILLATLLIFIAKDFNWTGPSAVYDSDRNWSAGSVHTLFGTMAILAALIQPIMALARCAPDTGARPIFNWTHRLLGLFALICALVAMFIATNSFVVLWSDHIWAFSIYLFFLVILILSMIIFEILDWMKTRSEHKVHSMEMRGRGTRYDDNGRVVTSTKVLHQRPMYATSLVWAAFGIFAFLVALVLTIMMII